MTSIEWLKKELEYFGDPDRCIISWEELDSLIEQAERINQKQLIVEIMEEDSKDGLYDIPLQECVNCNEQKQVHLMCLDCCIKLGNQNQTEISDEEIEKAAKEKHIGLSRDVASYRGCFEQGAKWYKEQLKKKQ